MVRNFRLLSWFALTWKFIKVKPENICSSGSGSLVEYGAKRARENSAAVGPFQRASVYRLWTGYGAVFEVRAFLRTNCNVLVFVCSTLFSISRTAFSPGWELDLPAIFRWLLNYTQVLNAFSLRGYTYALLFDFIVDWCHRGYNVWLREGRPQPEMVANNFRLYTTQRSLGMTVTRNTGNLNVRIELTPWRRQ